MNETMPTINRDQELVANLLKRVDEQSKIYQGLEAEGAMFSPDSKTVHNMLQETAKLVSLQSQLIKALEQQLTTCQENTGNN